MKKKLTIALIMVLLILELTFLGYQQWYSKTHVEIESADIRCDVTELTLYNKELPDRDTMLRLTQLEKLDVRRVPITIDQYTQLCADFPECEIQWLVPFQGNYLAPDIQELTITSLCDDDWTALPYLTNLQHIQAIGCRDYEQIAALIAAYPEVAVTYDVEILGTSYPQDVTELSLENANIDELTRLMPYMPCLERVTFTGTAPDNEAIYQLMCQYPDVEFFWDLTVFGVSTPNTATTLIFSGTPMDGTAELESILKFFPYLERVEVCDCGIPSEQMDILSQKYPSIRFVWTIYIRDRGMRTDAVAFNAYQLFDMKLTDLLTDEDCKDLKHCIDLQCLDLGHMKVSDVSFLKYMPKLKYLILIDMPCTDFSPIADLKDLIYLELFKIEFRQHELLLELKNLQDLNLGFTPTTDVSVLKQMTWLKRLWIPGTVLSRQQCKELVEALSETKVVTDARHSTDLGWRNNQNYRDMRDLLGMSYLP